jgi:virginiamycin B lyase
MSMAGVAACSLPALPGAAPKISTFPSQKVGDPTNIVAGADGNLWFTGLKTSAMARITTSGAVTSFDVPIASISGMTEGGADHGIWLTGLTAGTGGGGMIARISSDGAVTTVPLGSKSRPRGITSARDGSLWFTDAGEESVPGHPDQVTKAHKIGHMLPEGAITEISLPTPDGDPGGITVGADSNIWFSESSGGSIGRIDAQGAIREFKLPPGSRPGAIAAGPDQALWFTDNADRPENARIGRITTDGSATAFALPKCEAVCNRHLRGIAAGSDGNLWFTETKGYGEGNVWKTTTGGSMTAIAVKGWAAGITAGPDGNMWFTEDLDSLIGKVALK